MVLKTHFWKSQGKQFRTKVGRNPVCVSEELLCRQSSKVWPFPNVSLSVADFSLKMSWKETVPYPAHWKSKKCGSNARVRWSDTPKEMDKPRVSPAETTRVMRPVWMTFSSWNSEQRSTKNRFWMRTALRSASKFPPGHFRAQTYCTPDTRICFRCLTSISFVGTAAVVKAWEDESLKKVSCHCFAHLMNLRTVWILPRTSLSLLQSSCLQSLQRCIAILPCKNHLPAANDWNNSFGIRPSPIVGRCNLFRLLFALRPSVPTRKKIRWQSNWRKAGGEETKEQNLVAFTLATAERLKDGLMVSTKTFNSK